MRTQLRFAALALAGAMSFAAATRPASAAESSYGYCKLACGAVAAGCAATVSDVEFCSGMGIGCLYGCNPNAE
jgi:hypothetical protein